MILIQQKLFMIFPVQIRQTSWKKFTNSMEL